MTTLSHTEAQFFTMRAASIKLGVPYQKVVKAVNTGIIPSYSFVNKRKLIKLSEAIQIISQSKVMP